MPDTIDQAGKTAEDMRDIIKKIECIDCKAITAEQFKKIAITAVTNVMMEVR